MTDDEHVDRTYFGLFLRLVVVTVIRLQEHHARRRDERDERRKRAAEHCRGCMCKRK